MSAVRPFAAVLAALLLTGCITLLPKDKPVQLYRFGGAIQPASQPAPVGEPRFAVQPLVLSFNRAAAGDRILTVTGNEAAYISDARWVTGAMPLFESALTGAFDADPGPARLLTVGEAVRPDYFLKTDVRTFEVRYVRGQGSPPTIVVQVYGALSRPSERTLVGERLFTASVPASEDRAGAIARAFDQAVSQTVGDLVTWVNNKGAG